MFSKQWDTLLAQSPVLMLRWKTDSEHTLVALAGGVDLVSGLTFQVAQSFAQWIHSDDREHVIEQWSENDKLQLTYRLLTEDGAVYQATEYSQFATDQVNMREGVLIIQLMTEDESATKQRLERCEQELQDFAYIASHDMKEPLRKIQAFGDRLQNKFADELGEQGQDYLLRMLNATTRLQGFLDGLLEYSRVSTKTATPQSCNLELICNEEISRFHKEIDQLQARVAVAVLPTIEADIKQIHQLFYHLLDNALKFHIEGVRPIIAISAKQDDRQVWISIQDNGVGFQQADESKVFQIFQRLQGRSQYSGSGIGLAVCRKIVERHGGKIYAESSPGSGATFTFLLPLQVSLAEKHNAQK